MNLNKIVDATLFQFYSKERTGYDHQMEIIATKAGIAFDQSNSKIICDKIKELPYYDIIELGSKHGHDLVVMPNAKGFEFFQEYKSYSN